MALVSARSLSILPSVGRSLVQAAAGARLSASRVRRLKTEVRRARDSTRAGGAQSALVWLVKADAASAPFTITQAVKLIRLDVYRRIFYQADDVRLARIWGFYNSSEQTRDEESDLQTVLNSLDVQQADHMCRNQQLQEVEKRLSPETSVLVDLSCDSENVTTTTAKDYLQNHSAQLLRLSVLLESADISVEQPDGLVKFYRQFISLVDDHVARKLGEQHGDAATGEQDKEVYQILENQDRTYFQHLRSLETRKAMDVLWETVTMIKTLIESGDEKRPSAQCLLAAKGSVLNHLSLLGVTLDGERTQATAEGRISSIIDKLAAFRQQVRRFALKDIQQNADLMEACDNVRDELLKAGVKLQDKKNQTLWLWAPRKK